MIQMDQAIKNSGEKIKYNGKGIIDFIDII